MDFSTIVTVDYKYQYSNFTRVSFQLVPDDCYVHETQVVPNVEEQMHIYYYYKR